MRTRHVPFLARRVKSGAAQRSLLKSNVSDKEGLAQNANLDEGVWFTLSKKCKVGVAVGLVSRTLNEEQLNAFLKEKRVTVHRSLVGNGLSGCSLGMARSVIDTPWFNSEIASIWLQAKSVHKDVFKEVLLVENNREMIKALVDKSLFTDDEVIDLLLKANKNRGKLQLWHLFDGRPSILDKVIRNEKFGYEVLESAAGCRHLFDRELFEILVERSAKLGSSSYSGTEIWTTVMLNPNTPIDIVEKLVSMAPAGYRSSVARHRTTTNVEMAKWVRSKIVKQREIGVISSDWSELEGDALEIAKESYAMLNSRRYPSLPWSTVMQRPEVVANTRKYMDVEEFLELNVQDRNSHFEMQKDVLEFIESSLDSIGEAAWDVFWSLVDDWEGTFRELIESSLSLSVK
ncbi:MAG: hypothetical protein ACKOW9_05545 [Candidatus Paceibacterota bacterium]